MDNFGIAQRSDVDHNSNSLDYSVSDSEDYVDFRTDHSSPTEVNANFVDPYSCTIHHESNIEEDENPLHRFRYAANGTTLI